MIVVVLLALITGCATEAPAPAPAPAPPPVETPAPQTDVDKAASVARAIAADPSKAGEALAAVGWTEAQLEAALYTIAADEAKTAAYLAARK